MNDLAYNQLKELIELATSRGLFEYVSVILPSVVTFAAVSLSYLFFKKHAVQVTNEKIIEKDVEKLYEAVDCIFTYSDSVGLYLSLKSKEYQILIDGNLDARDEDFVAKIDHARESMYENFSSAHKASFMLRALGEKGASLMVDSYRDHTVNLRKKFYRLDNEFKKVNQTDPMAAFMQEFENERAQLTLELNKCLDEVVECKKRIKAITS